MSKALYDLPIWMQRLLALVILSMLLSGPTFGFSQALFDYVRNEELIVEKRLQLWRFESFANYILDQPPVQSALDNNEGTGVGNEEFLTTDLEPVMMAQLQTRLKNIAKSHGVSVLAVGSVPEVIDNNVRYIGLRMSASGTYKSLYGMLLDIETSRPYLLIHQAHLRSSASSIRDVSRDVEISAQLSVFGAVSKPPVKLTGPNP